MTGTATKATSSTEVAVTAELYRSRPAETVTKPVTFAPNGPCGGCGVINVDTAPAVDVISANFGRWDDIMVNPSDGARYLCPACAYCYSNVTLRRTPMLIQQGEGAHPVTMPEARNLLSRPLDARTALIVPLSGKKTLAPQARWGHVTFDGGTFHWARTHHEWLRAAAWLRGQGANETGLAEPSPPHVVLSRLDFEGHKAVYDAWRLLGPCREDRLMFALIVTLTRGIDPGSQISGTRAGLATASR